MNTKKIKKMFLLISFIILSSSIIYSESIKIQNLEILGLPNANQEFTSSRTVALMINITSNATKCSYSNEDSYFSVWESCTELKYWLLTNGSGLKTVYVNINHTNGINNTYFDTITYDYTGSGLDTTPPSDVTILSSNYSNNNKNSCF